jgi:hypothetical protein
MHISITTISCILRRADADEDADVVRRADSTHVGAIARGILLSVAIVCFAAPLAASAQDAHGGCLPADLYRAAADLTTGLDDSGDVVAAACRDWPFDPALRLSAVAFATGAHDESRGGRPIELVIGVRRGAELVAATTSDASEDASVRWSEGALAIDTARYDLAPGRRAFGVIERTGYSPRCAEGSADNRLTLFVIDGASLRPVLNLFLTHGLTLQGGCFSEQEVIERNATITIALADGAHNGFRDLSIRADIAGADATTYTAVVAYDGERYDLSDWESGFERVFYASLHR